MEGVRLVSTPFYAVYAMGNAYARFFIVPRICNLFQSSILGWILRAARESVFVFYTVFLRAGGGRAGEKTALEKAGKG